MTLALLVCYEGTRRSGWQVQSNAESIQSLLEGAVYSAFSEKTHIVASGRTDAGVHAAGQVCSLALHNKNVKPERVADAINRYLPEDIRVLKSAAAPDGFDACRAAKQKTYRYRFYASERQNPLKERYAAQIKSMPDLEKMRAAARAIEGEHDFRCFCASGSSAKSTVREVISVKITVVNSLGGADLLLDVCGKGFLYNMVRIIAGTVIACGCNKIPIGDIARAFETGERSLLGKTMPAKGLTLMHVDYGFPLFQSEN